jgi:hypothetical protein
MGFVRKFRQLAIVSSTQLLRVTISSFNTPVRENWSYQLSRSAVSRLEQPRPDIAELRAATKQHRFIQLAPEDFKDVRCALLTGDA